MATIQPTKIEGLRELQAALKALDGESQKKIRVFLNEVAQTVVGGASRRVPVRKGRARASLKAMSGQREAKVQGGGSKAPYYGWLDFGGTVGKGRVAAGVAKKRAGGASGGTAGSVTRPWFPGGRYIYPAYAANRDSIQGALEKGLAELIREAGLEPSDG